MRVWAGVCGFSQMSDVSGFASVCGGAGVRGCAQMCEDVHRYVWVCTGVRWCVRGYGWVYTCVWDEFSEFLLENRVPTSADFNTYPIRIL